MLTTELHGAERPRVVLRPRVHPQVAHRRPLQRLGLLRQRKRELPDHQHSDAPTHGESEAAELVHDVEQRTEQVDGLAPEGVGEPRLRRARGPGVGWGGVKWPGGVLRDCGAHQDGGEEEGEQLRLLQQ